MPGRSFDALHHALARGEIHPAYYFHGDQDLLKDDAVRRILDLVVEGSAKDFNLDRRRAPELAAQDFRALVETPPLLAARRAVVVTEIEWLRQKRPKSQALRTAVTAYLERPFPETVLVLVQSAGEKPDGELERGSCSVDFETLPPERVARWIRHRAAAEELEIDESAARHLLEAVGDDLPQLAAEISKLAAATAGRPATATDVAELVGVRHGETVHDFVDAITARRLVPAAGMVPRLLQSPGNSGVRLVGALGTALLGVALARSCLDAGDGPGAAADRVLKILYGARPMGLRSWKEEAGRWVKDAARWRSEELDAALAALLRADARLKDTRLSGETEIVVELVLSLGEPGAEAA